MAEATTEFPQSAPTRELMKFNPEVEPEKCEDNRLLYTGGSEIMKPENISRFIVKRTIEKTNHDHYAARIAKAWYINRFSALVDWIVAAVCKNEPRIIATDDKDGFWESLNKNADGYGRNFAQLVRLVARDTLLYRRGYFGIDFPEPLGRAADDSSDARMCWFSALNVRDWQLDDNGNLVMARVDTSRLIRPNTWSQPDKKEFNWTFYTPTECANYQVTRKIGLEGPAENELAYLDKKYTKPHDFGVVPIFPVEIERDMWVGDKAKSPAVALWNREAAITFALDQTAYAMLYFTLENEERLSNVVATEMAALKMRIGEGVGFASPDAQIFDPLFRDGERLKTSLYEVLQTLAANALATQTQNARQSGDAKEMDMQPMNTLLKSYAWPIRDALERMVDALKKHRGEEDNDVTIHGLDEFDSTMDEAHDDLAPEDENGDDEKTGGGNADKSGFGLSALLQKAGGLRTIARKAGISPGAISAMANGTRTPSPANAKKLAAALGVSVEQIVGMTQKKVKNG